MKGVDFCLASIINDFYLFIWEGFKFRLIKLGHVISKVFTPSLLNYLSVVTNILIEFLFLLLVFDILIIFFSILLLTLIIYSLN